jgi:hypothetical protein
VVAAERDHDQVDQPPDLLAHVARAKVELTRYGVRTHRVTPQTHDLLLLFRERPQVVSSDRTSQLCPLEHAPPPRRGASDPCKIRPRARHNNAIAFPGKGAIPRATHTFIAAPPSMVRTWPLTKRDSSQARKRTALATSSAVPGPGVSWAIANGRSKML